MLVYEWTGQGEGHRTHELEQTVSAGQMNRAATVTLDESGIPIPELSGTILIVFATFALAFGTIRTRPERTGKKTGR